MSSWAAVLSGRVPVVGGTPSLIAHADAADNANVGFATTSSATTTGANLIVVHVAWFSLSTPTAVVSDSKGNTWSPLTASVSDATWSSQFFYCSSPTVGSGHTFTATAASASAVVTFQAWSNMSTSSVFDQQNGGTGVGTSSVATGSITPSQANTVVIVGYVANNSRTFSSFSDGTYTSSDTETGTGTGLGGMGYKVFTAASAQNITVNFSGNSTNAAVIASFKY